MWRKTLRCTMMGSCGMSVDPWYFARLGLYWGMPTKWYVKCLNGPLPKTHKL